MIISLIDVCIHLELNNTRFFFKIIISVIVKVWLSIEMIAEKKIVIFLQYIEYYSFTSMHVYLCNKHLCNKNMNLIMYEQIFMLIIANIYQLSMSVFFNYLGDFYYTVENFAQDWRSLIVFRRCIGLLFVTLPCSSRFILFSYFLLSHKQSRRTEFND